MATNKARADARVVLNTYYNWMDNPTKNGVIARMDEAGVFRDDPEPPPPRHPYTNGSTVVYHPPRT